MSNNIKSIYRLLLSGRAIEVSVNHSGSHYLVEVIKVYFHYVPIYYRLSPISLKPTVSLLQGFFQ
jgi:hypothetical protein